MEWTPEVIERLQTLWAEGHSTAEIGRRLLVSKNAVVGKAHRLNLAARPSPIRRGGAPGASSVPRAPRRAAGACTLPPLSVCPVETAPPPVVPAAPAQGPRPVAVPPRSHARVVACCWPIGEPGTRSFRFCDDEAMQGKPYCVAHAQLAYVKVRDRREDAA